MNDILIIPDIRQLKNKPAGPDWFNLPAPAEADLPRLYREVEALRLRNQLDPKRFYKKDEGEGKGIKGLPKHFAVGVSLSCILNLNYHSDSFHRCFSTDWYDHYIKYTIWYCQCGQSHTGEPEKNTCG